MLIIGTEEREIQRDRDWVWHADKDENNRERKEDRKAGRKKQERKARYGKGKLDQEGHNEEEWNIIRRGTLYLLEKQATQVL